MNSGLYQIRPKKFLHELILDQAKGKHRGYCRCGKQSPQTEVTQEVQDWYKDHLTKSGIREAKKRGLLSDELDE